MIVQDIMNTIEQRPGYIPNSLIKKSFDDRGLVLKWLENNAGKGDRKQMFVELNESEKNIAKLEKRTAASNIMVNNPV